MTLLDLMWSSHASQNAFTAILVAVFWMSMLMYSTEVNTGVKTRSEKQVKLWLRDLALFHTIYRLIFSPSVPNQYPMLNLPMNSMT